MKVIQEGVPGYSPTDRRLRIVVTHNTYGSAQLSGHSISSTPDSGALLAQADEQASKLGGGQPPPVFYSMKMVCFS